MKQINIALISIFLLSACTPQSVLPPNQNYTACTLEAKICPDGLAVGRTGPNCEFAACPEVVEDIILILIAALRVGITLMV